MWSVESLNQNLNLSGVLNNLTNPNKNALIGAKFGGGSAGGNSLIGYTEIDTGGNNQIDPSPILDSGNDSEGGGTTDTTDPNTDASDNDSNGDSSEGASTTSDCGDNEEYSEDDGTCICKDGFVRDSVSGECNQVQTSAGSSPYSFSNMAMPYGFDMNKLLLAFGLLAGSGYAYINREEIKGFFKSLKN